jgi:quercetin dioxygenase-like cupin family protein
MTTQAQNMHVPADSGPALWGPGDRYTFLVTGEQSGGAYFILEAFVPPGGGPPPHIHQREEECFYLLQGHLTMTLGDQKLKVAAGDFVQIARGTVHTFTNDGENEARMLAFFSPAGMEHWMTESLDPALDRVSTPPPPTPEMIARMIAAAPHNGVVFV